MSTRFQLLELDENVEGQADPASTQPNLRPIEVDDGQTFDESTCDRGFDPDSAIARAAASKTIIESTARDAGSIGSPTSGSPRVRSFMGVELRPAPVQVQPQRAAGPTALEQEAARLRTELADLRAQQAVQQRALDFQSMNERIEREVHDRLRRQQQAEQQQNSAMVTFNPVAIHEFRVARQRDPTPQELFELGERVGVLRPASGQPSTTKRPVLTDTVAAFVRNPGFGGAFGGGSF